MTTFSTIRMLTVLSVKSRVPHANTGTRINNLELVSQMQGWNILTMSFDPQRHGTSLLRLKPEKNDMLEEVKNK